MHIVQTTIYTIIIPVVSFHTNYFFCFEIAELILVLAPLDEIDWSSFPVSEVRVPKRAWSTKSLVFILSKFEEILIYPLLFLP